MSQKSKKDKVINVRLTNRDLHILEEMSEYIGESNSSLIRVLINELWFLRITDEVKLSLKKLREIEREHDINIL